MRRVAEQAELAAEAYIYRYLPVRSLDEIASSVAGGGSLPIQAPYNEFGHARNLAGPEVKFGLAPRGSCASGISSR
jgi:hypothetical protein